jgi:hypothetical protein
MSTSGNESSELQLYQALLNILPKGKSGKEIVSRARHLYQALVKSTPDAKLEELNAVISLHSCHVNLKDVPVPSVDEEND